MIISSVLLRIDFNKICKILIVGCSIINSQYSYSQGMNSGDTLTSKRGTRIFIKQENSKEMSIIAQALLFNVESGTGNALKVTTGIEGDYYLPKFASVHLGIMTTYLDIQKSSASDLNKSANSLNRFSEFEIGGRFHIFDKIALKRCKTQLSNNGSSMDHFYASQSGGSISENYLIAKLPARRILAARGGLLRQTTIVSTDMNQSNASVNNVGAVTTKDGTVFSDVYFTNAHTTSVYIGLSEIFNMKVKIKPLNIDEFSSSSYFKSLLKETYFDILLATTSFDPFVVDGKSYEIEPNAKGSFQTSNIGFRAGKKIIFTRKTVNLGFGFEIGNRPGVSGHGYYFNSAMTIAYVR